MRSARAPRADLSPAVAIKVAGARLWATTRWPYFSTGLFALIVVEVAGLGTITADDRWRLYVDPDVLEEWSTEEVGTALVHHLGHLLRDHAGRSRSRSVGGWQNAEWILACDLEIDDDLVADRGSFPEPPRLPADFGWEDGQLAETYFERLLGAKEDPGRPQPGNKKSAGEKTEEKTEDPAPARKRSTSGPDDRTDPDSPEEPPAPGRADDRAEQPPGAQPPGDHGHPETDEVLPGCGSCADGVERPWELGDTGDADQDGLQPMEAEMVRAEVGHEIIQHTKTHGRDSVPAAYLRWAEPKKPTVDWRSLLARQIRKGLCQVTGRVDYSYGRRSRRASAVPGVILPGTTRPVPEVAVVVDTSASMSPTDLAHAVGEVDGVIKRLGLGSRRLPVLACDTQVSAITRVRHGKEVVLSGGGGTEMTEGIEAALRLTPKPKVVIVLTDGYTDWPRRAPKGVAVAVGLIGRNAQDTVPKWAGKVWIGRKP